ncbi:MAG TPA: DNA methyltransferase, partial [Bellilinea sp.]|nr:DNA methyltransferase [Bellilinea sp.]
MTALLSEHSVTSLDVVHHADALSLLRGLPGASVDLIATDPPYNMRKFPGDTFESDAALVRWLGVHFAEMRRVLKANGSVYVFTWPSLADLLSVEMRRHFNVLSHVVWRKDQARHKSAEIEGLRAFFPQSERIIFAEQYGADSPYQDALIDGNSTYWGACEDTKRGIFGAYLVAEFERAHASRREIAALFPSKTGGLTGCVSNWVLGYNIPTPEQYQAMRDYLNAHHMNGSGEYLRREYEDLRREYEDLRREYEDLRRPFNATPDAPYTDVWDFPTVGAYPGKHPAEKP